MNLKTLLITFALAGAAWLQAQPENKIILNLEPSKAFPRSSEGAFATLKSGRILFCYSQFYGGYGDNDSSKIAEVHSDDNGETWSAPRVLVDNGLNLNLMSVSFLRLTSGKLAMFYLIKQSPPECHPVMQVTSDEGQTWSAPVSMIDAHGFFVLNNDRVIQTRSGRLIAPIGFHFQRQKDRESGAIAMWYYSDNEGATWLDSDTSWSMPILSRSGLQEPGVVELADGSILSWSRTDGGTQYGFHSYDNGATWSPPEPTALISPVSPASIKRLPSSFDLLAIFNDHSGRFPFSAATNPYKARTPLVAAISHDGGATWPIRKVLENDPAGRYCYTAIHFAGDSVFLAYSAADAQALHFGRLRLRRVARAWFTAP